jgi:flagellar hook-length control protein FliK
MIPAIAVVASPAVDSGVASVGDSATLLEGAAEGRFAAALQQLLDTAEGPATGIDGSGGLAEGSDQGAAESVEQSVSLPQSQAVITVPNPNPEPQTTAVPGAADPLQWLMMMQATAPPPQSTVIGEGNADTTELAVLIPEMTAVSDQDVASGVAATDATDVADASNTREFVASHSLGTAGREGGVSEMPLHAESAEPLRAAAGLEQNIAPRSPAEPAPRATPPPVLTPMHAPQWSDEFAARVNWLVDRGDQMATIRLTPEQLGPVEVRLAIREGEASIWFGAAQAETRAAIEQALPRLREMLAASGLSLADSGVFQQAPRDPRQGFLSSDARRAALESAATPGELQLRSRHLGLIDDYA